MYSILCAFSLHGVVDVTSYQKKKKVLSCPTRTQTALCRLLRSGLDKLNKLKWPPKNWMCGDMFSQRCRLQALAQTPEG